LTKFPKGSVAVAMSTRFFHMEKRGFIMIGSIFPVCHPFPGISGIDGAKTLSTGWKPVLRESVAGLRWAIYVRIPMHNELPAVGTSPPDLQFGGKIISTSALYNEWAVF
jgi:hypothetical protein